LYTYFSWFIRFETIEGHGSIFHFIASLTSCQPDLPAIPPVILEKILVVVRHELLRRLLSEQLLAWGCRVESVGTSAEALRLPKEGHSLIVADINGRPDDASLLKYFQLPAILLRLGGEEERLKEVKEKTGPILLFKPVRTEEFRRAIFRALNPAHPGTLSFKFNLNLFIISSVHCAHVF
jgi:CheY-like chemotaxis protein